KGPAAETLAGGGAEVLVPVGHGAAQPGADAPELRAVPPGCGEPADSPGPHPDFPGASLPAGQEAAGSALVADAVMGAQAGARVDPGTPGTGPRVRPTPRWPLLLLAAPAFVAVWSGWVGLGSLAGFGMVHPLPGIADQFSINS